MSDKKIHGFYLETKVKEDAVKKLEKMKADGELPASTALTFVVSRLLQKWLKHEVSL